MYFMMGSPLGWMIAAVTFYHHVAQYTVKMTPRAAFLSITHKWPVGQPI
jgi:hypothetical protein